MTSPWSIPIFTNLTIPTTAGPGQARIVLASQLPPPLDTYVSASGPYSGAIIFYGEGDDTTYAFYGIVEDGLGQTVITDQGAVVAGTVQEFVAGTPQGIQQYAGILGISINLRGNGIIIHGINSGVAIQTTAGDISLTSGAFVRIDGAELIISTDIDWASATTTESEDLAGVATVSAAYVQLGAIGHAFVAPPSGMVMVNHNAGLDNVVAGNAAYCGFEIRAGAVVGAGAVAFAVNDSYAIQLQGQDQIRAGRSKRVTGLTPGSTYNVSLWQRSSVAGNNVAFADRVVSVVPVF